MHKVLVYFLFLFLLLSCSRKKWSEEVEPIALPGFNGGNFYDVLVDNKGQIHIVGGVRLERNDFYQSNDNGASWHLFHFDEVQYSNKAVFALGMLNDTVFATSYDGKVFKNNAGANNVWELFLGDAWWYTFSGISFGQNNIGFVAGNQGFQQGLIVKINSSMQTLQVDSFPFSINDVAVVDAQTSYAVGYGALLQTKDGGQNWQQLNLTDDNYRSLFVVDKDNVWTVGFNGTIAHITDNGSKQTKIKNGQNPLSNTDRYLDIKFKGQEGYIVGEKGVVLYTSNGGKDWKKMKKFTKEDLRAVAFHPIENTVFLVGSNGAAFKYHP